MTFGIIHASELLAMENYFGQQILFFPHNKEKILGTFMREPQFSQELKALQDIIHLKTRHFQLHKFRRISSLNSTH